MITEENHSGRVEDAAAVQLLQIKFHSLVHRRRVAYVVMTKCVGPEKSEERIVFVRRREVERVLINEVRVVLKAEAKLQRAFVLDFQILLGRHRERSIVVRGGLIKEAELMIIERPNFCFVFRVSSHVAAILEMLPHERTFVEISNLFRVARLISVRLIEAC